MNRRDFLKGASRMGAKMMAGACCALMAFVGFAGGDWYADAKLGVFVHWGLYAIPGQGEWAMSRNGMPEAEYAALAKEWNPKAGAEDALVRDAVRRWQPGILINDRAGTKEDFQTIEGRNIPRPPEDAKRWESCLTLQDDDWSFWGYCNHTAFRKTSEQIVCQLLHCLELGGNLLVNIGPSGDGSVDQWQRDLLAKVGDWIGAHREAVYGSHPTEVAAKMPLAKGWSGNSCGFFTETDDRYYLFLHAWPGERTTFPHFTGHVRAVRLNGREIPFALDESARRLTLTGLPKDPPKDICPVLELFKDAGTRQD